MSLATGGGSFWSLTDYNTKDSKYEATDLNVVTELTKNLPKSRGITFTYKVLQKLCKAHASDFTDFFWWTTAVRSAIEMPKLLRK